MLSTVLNLHLLRVEEQEETLVNIKHKHATEFPHVFAHAHDIHVELSHSESMLIDRDVKQTLRVQKI